MVYGCQSGYDFETALATAGSLLRRRAPVPTAEQLRRHAERFGPDGVNETARQLGVETCVRPAQKAKQRRHTTRNLRGQVLELHRRGAMAEAIADTLDVSDRRVQSILASASEAA